MNRKFIADVSLTSPDEYGGGEEFKLNVYRHAYTDRKDWLICIDNGSGDGPYISLSALLAALKQEGISLE